MPDRLHTDTASGATPADSRNPARGAASAGSAGSAAVEAPAAPSFERGPQGALGPRGNEADAEMGLERSKESLVNGSNASEDEVQDLIDAVAGATWNTRNRIMEERFLAALDKGESRVPAFKPPGSSLGSA
ncbi:hypothetical protein [Raoultibacter timonensis]|uniref:Uncharacterized protein n=2 Tax=Raoultibacter timonensis TaxID=1907662 RepID=A0ABN6MHP0_9ACTN|nr:hypothetical protein [Raoultibacter timonensis]BDE95816.1 hypothetical protein CE91St30_11490 [Raoultibacter timonensis]BDF50420.1 hypothetical protein CE91St31_11500 [Raoultibacter timonensis]